MRSPELLMILIVVHCFSYSVNILINRRQDLNFVTCKFNLLHSSGMPRFSFRHDPAFQKCASANVLIRPPPVFTSKLKYYSHIGEPCLALSMARNSESRNPPERQRRTREQNQKVNASSHVDVLRASVERKDPIKPPLSAFNHALRACAQDEQGLHLAEQVVSLMLQANVSGDQRSFNILLRCVADSSAERGEAAFLQGLDIFNVSFYFSFNSFNLCGDVIFLLQ